MTLEMQVKKLLGINAVQNIMAKFQYYYTAKKSLHLRGKHPRGLQVLTVWAADGSRSTP